jgi:hypothetical protein
MSMIFLNELKSFTVTGGRGMSLVFLAKTEAWLGEDFVVDMAIFMIALRKIPKPLLYLMAHPAVWPFRLGKRNGEAEEGHRLRLFVSPYYEPRGRRHSIL